MVCIYKGREVRKHFAVLDKIMRQLIFYDTISLEKTMENPGHFLIAFELIKLHEADYKKNRKLFKVVY